MKLRSRNDYSSLKLYRNNYNFSNNPVTTTEAHAESAIADLPKGKLSLLKQLLYFSERYPSIFLSQGRFAQLCGLSREYVNRSFSFFEEKGILKMLYRHKTSSKYKLTDVFTKEFKAKISIYFRVFPLTLILSISAPNAALGKKSLKIYKGEYNYINTRSVEREFTNARVYENGKTAFKKEEERTRVMLLPSDKKKILEQLSHGIRPDNFPSQAVRSIADIPLSRYGQIKLSAFPDFVLKKALQETRTMKFLKDPFSYLFSRCIKLCREQNITPDFSWVDSLKRALKMDDSMSPVLAKPSRSISTLENAIISNREIIAKYKKDNISSDDGLLKAEDYIYEKTANNPGLKVVFQYLFVNIEKHKQSKQ